MELHQDPVGAFDAAAALPLIRGLTPLHELVALVDPDGGIAWLSDGLAAACGGADSLKGRPFVELIADACEAEQLAQALAEQGRVSNQPVTLLGGQGNRIRLSVSAARLGPAGEGHPTVAIFRTDRDSEQLDREFRLTVDYLSAILESSPDGVVVVDRSRFVTYANTAMAELTGYSIDDLVDKPLVLFLRSQEDLEQIADALKPGSPLRNHDLEVRRKDGSALCVSVSASLLRLRDGTYVGSVAYLRDVTERRRFEAGLAHKNAELEHTVQAVAHDLRSPLVSLMGFTRLLGEDFGDRMDEKGRHFLTRIQEAGRTIESLIDDLLELSKIGRSRPAKEWIDANEVLQQLRAELKPRLDEAGISLEIADELPMVVCDRTRLYQVFSNLIGNALDYMGPAEAPCIRIEIETEPGARCISVRDNGRGIDPADHERVFEIFQSIGRRADGRRGTGLGLAIVRKIAEIHGGEAWVESQAQGGCSFRVRLPSHED